MRTTIYINIDQLDDLKAAMTKIDVSKKEMISLLLTRIIRKSSFEAESFKPVRYQMKGLGIKRKIEHIDLEDVFYEKALDLRRNFKFSVSWFIAFGIINYLNELVNEMSNPKNPEKIMDNYDRNSVYIARMLGGVQVFISMLGYPKLKNI